MLDSGHMRTGDFSEIPTSLHACPLFSERQNTFRMALGADRASVLWMVLRETVGLVLCGIAVGLPLALAATRLIGKFLFGLTPADPLTLAIAVVTLLAAAAMAGFLPAHRASGIDPMVALRYE
jgi:ABC-type antimicrobial peptide transport system permease subunit